MLNQRFGHLTVLQEAGRTAAQKVRWLCRCDCGQMTAVVSSDLRNGHTRSCGCLHRKELSLRRTIHGAARLGQKTIEYRTWISMMRRCYNQNTKDYKNYGGRGIEVCERWHKFENFLADMGPRPAGEYSIERVNVNGNYEPSNCIWLPKSQQSKNRRNN